MIWVATFGLSTYVGFVTEMQSRWRLDLAVEIASRLLPHTLGTMIVLD